MDKEENICIDNAIGKTTMHISTATCEQIIDQANKIWKIVLERMDDKKLTKKSTSQDSQKKELLNELQDSYKDFNISFPIVLRWMVEAKKYKAKVFKQYLLKYAKAEFKTSEDFVKMQAEYLVCIFENDNPHVSQKNINKFRDTTVNAMLEEDREFKKIYARIEKELEVEKQLSDQERRIRLVKLIKEGYINS